MEVQMYGRIARACLPVLLLCPLLGAHAGGWAVITLDALPDHAVAQQPLELTFMVRQHGAEPMTDLKPAVTARAGKLVTSAVATRTNRPGQYRVSLTMPEPGDYAITIDPHFADSKVTLPAVRATGAGALDVPQYSAAERGLRLFVAKGCISCHQHSRASGARSFPVGPELSTPRLAPAVLAKFLADPSIQPPTGNFRMPNLQLKDTEIAALVAFLSTEHE
jgi:cytochrome c551/c552